MLRVRLGEGSFEVRIHSAKAMRAEDVVHLVVKKRSLIGTRSAWLPERVAEVQVKVRGEDMERSAMVSPGETVYLWPREWRRRKFDDRVPGDALREAFAYAGGNYRSVCRRFRDEASAVVRLVRLPPSLSAHRCRAFARAFAKARIVIARGCQDSLVEALPVFSQLRALDLRGAEVPPTLWSQLPPQLEALDVSGMTSFNDDALACLTNLKAIDMTGTSVTVKASFFGKLTHLAADAPVAGRWALETAVKCSFDAHLTTFAATGRLSNVDDVLAAVVRVSAMATTLTSLRLSRSSLRDAHLVNLRGLSCLRDLDLSFNRISDNGMKLLWGPGGPTPRNLNLRGCDLLTDATLAVLPETLIDVDLELLWRLTANGVIAFAHRCPLLRDLYLRGAASVLRKQIRDEARSVVVHFGPRFSDGSESPSPLRSWFHPQSNDD